MEMIDFEFLDELMEGGLSLMMDCYQFDDEPDFTAVQLG